MVLERYESLVDDFAAFEAACERRLPSVVRVNTMKATVDRACRALDQGGYAPEPVGWNPKLFRLDRAPGNSWPYVHGWLYGQEEVSALPALVLDPQPGERVLDTCAAPGSKTTQLAALMDDRGTLVANDNNLGRLSALRSNAERCGVTNLVVTNQDARNYSLKPFTPASGSADADAESGGAETDGDEGDAAEQASGDEGDAAEQANGDEGDAAEPLFDRVLADVPCTCEGTIRKNPDALDDWSLGHVHSVAGLQKGLLRRAVQVTRPGGTVVYSTCTFAPEENEAVLDAVLEAEDCRIVAFETPLETVPGVTGWNGDTYDDSVALARRVYPHLNDTGGFFVGKLEVTG